MLAFDSVREAAFPSAFSSAIRRASATFFAPSVLRLASRAACWARVSRDRLRVEPALAVGAVAADAAVRCDLAVATLHFDE